MGMKRLEQSCKAGFKRNINIEKRQHPEPLLQPISSDRLATEEDCAQYHRNLSGAKRLAHNDLLHRG